MTNNETALYTGVRNNSFQNNYICNKKKQFKKDVWFSLKLEYFKNKQQRNVCENVLVDLNSHQVGDVLNYLGADGIKQPIRGPTEPKHLIKDELHMPNFGEWHRTSDCLRDERTVSESSSFSSKPQ